MGTNIKSFGEARKPSYLFGVAAPVITKNSTGTVIVLFLSDTTNLKTSFKPSPQKNNGQPKPSGAYCAWPGDVPFLLASPVFYFFFTGWCIINASISALTFSGSSFCNRYAWVPCSSFVQPLSPPCKVIDPFCSL